VYYAPALMSKNCGTDALGALGLLAEVLRQARALWPLEESSAAENVALRIDALKELQVAAILDLPPGEFWVLERTSGIDAQVRRMSLRDANLPNWAALRVLSFTANGAC
jgi:hypothetical protein